MAKIGMKILVEKTGTETLEHLGVKNWPVWEKEISEFDWYYDTQEQCFIIEGSAEVVVGNEKVTFGAGDFVTFPAGLSCQWRVLEPIRKHYRFE